MFGFFACFQLPIRTNMAISAIAAILAATWLPEPCAWLASSLFMKHRPIAWCIRGCFQAWRAFIDVLRTTWRGLTSFQSKAANDRADEFVLIRSTMDQLLLLGA